MRKDGTRVFISLIACLAWACGNNEGNSPADDAGDTDTAAVLDTDTDADADTDTDTDTDADTDTGADTNTNADTGTDSGCGVITSPGGFGVVGNQVVDSNCAKVVFHGVNCPSLEWWAPGQNLYENNFAEVASWGANLIRLPLNQAFWLEWGDNDHTAYRARVQEVVGWANSHGLNIILDLHRAPLQGAQVNEQQDMANLDSLTFWTEVATLFRDQPHVLFELYNEPRNITWEQWRDGGIHPDGWTIVGTQQLYDAIRATGAHNLVLVGGLNWAYALDGLVDYPLNGYNIAYVTHLYNYGNKQPATWEQDWLFMAQNAPVFVTEFGPGPNDGVAVNQYVQDVLATADAHALHWTAWAFYSFSTNGMVDSSWDPQNDSFPLTPFGEHIRDKLLSF